MPVHAPRQQSPAQEPQAKQPLAKDPLRTGNTAGTHRPIHSSRKQWVKPVVATLVLLVAAAFIVAGWLRWPYGQARVLKTLGKDFSSEVTVRSFRTVYFPRPGYIAEGVVLQRIGQDGSPPLATARKITSYGSYLGLYMVPENIHSFRVEGLVVRIPKTLPASNGSSRPTPWWRALRIDRVIADGSVLQILPESSEVHPLVFSIHTLRLHAFATGKPLSFEASFQNPAPVGEVETRGQLGPLNANHLGQTAVFGSYTLKNARLATFPDISGTLFSQANFHGVLHDVRVQGTASTPDFELLSVRHPISLNVKFMADVDGMDGDVRLDSIEAHFRHTAIWSTGFVKSELGQPGKVTTLSMTVREGRIEDLLYPFVQSQPPPMEGTAHLQARGVFPYSGGPFLKRIRMAGAFDVEDSGFTHPEFQHTIDKLSERSKGKKNNDLKKTRANLQATVRLDAGVGQFSSLVFQIPGADAHLHGTYNLIDERVNLTGKLGTRGTLSQDTTGIKSILLWPFSPLFKHRRRGAVMPVHITGTYQHPTYGVSF